MRKSLAACIGVLTILGFQGIDRREPESNAQIHEIARATLPSSVKIDRDFLDYQQRPP